ncbi:MAG: hypothetical protein ACUVRO_10980 [Armatimonadota bacterium]
MTNGEAVVLKALRTTDIGSSLLNDEQANEFVRQVFSSTPTLKSCRTVMMRARKMNIDRLRIGQRLLRKKSEGAALSTYMRPWTETVQLSAVDLQLPWEVTEETIRYNIEGEAFEDTLIQMMTAQVGVDLSDLAWNGDTTDPASTTINDADGIGATELGALTVVSTSGYPNAGTLICGTERIKYDGKTATTFNMVERGADGTTAAPHANGSSVDLAADGLLTATDGWIKKANAAGRSVDGLAINGGEISKEHFIAAVKAMPAQYLDGGSGARYRWFLHPLQYAKWVDYLSARATAAGDAALIGDPQRPGPFGYPVVQDATMPKDTIVFTDPRNLIVGLTKEIAVRRDASSRDVISRGVRYYQIDLAADVQIELADAVVKITGLSVS